MKKRYLYILLFFSYFSISQIVVTNFPPMDTEQYLVNDVLLGGGIVTSNFSSTGLAQGIGYFDGFNSINFNKDSLVNAINPNCL